MVENQIVSKKKAKPSKKKSSKSLKVIIVHSKRKASIARLSVKEGAGMIRLNSSLLNIYEPRELRALMLEPITSFPIALEIASRVTIDINVNGGGMSSQAQAVRGAIAKGLVKFSENDTLKAEYMGYDRFMLVDDVRRVEPKKFNGPKARARNQTSYR